MKAIVHNRYGSSEVLEYKEIDPPVLRDDDLLLRVHAASVNAGDLFAMRGSPWLARLSTGLPRPKDHVLGWDAAGVVEAVGKNVTRFQPGDAVYCACSGSFADYARIREGAVALKPAKSSPSSTGPIRCVRRARPCAISKRSTRVARSCSRWRRIDRLGRRSSTSPRSRTSNPLSKRTVQETWQTHKSSSRRYG